MRYLQNDQCTVRWLIRHTTMFVLFLLWLYSNLELVQAQSKPLIATTNEPRLLENGGAGIMLGMIEAEYQPYAAQLTAKLPGFVAMKRKPEKLSLQARFGINLSYGGHNRTWALDGDEKQGFVLYADFNANGDLSDDAPHRFTLQDGKHSLRLQLTVKAANSEDTYPLVIKLVVDEIAPPGETEKRRCLLNYEDAVREGTIQVGNRSLLFSLTGSSGVYNERYNRVAFDLNGDGKLDSKTERYQVREKFVNIGDTSFEYTVDRYGRSLTLTPLAEKLPPRAILLSGHPAPDFAFTDLNGKPRKLSEYRGKVVLLNFWGTWCGPCVAAAPRLVETYEKYQARGFDVLGITVHDGAEQVRTFATEKKMNWTQTREDDESGPLHRLYRITAWPTYILVGKDGTIIKDATEGRQMDLAAELEKALASK